MKKLIKKIIKNPPKSYRADKLFVGNIIEVFYTKHFNIMNMTQFQFHTIKSNLIFIKKDQKFLHLKSNTFYDTTNNVETGKQFVYNITPLDNFFQIEKYGYHKNHKFTLEELNEIELRGEQFFQEHNICFKS